MKFFIGKSLLAMAITAATSGVFAGPSTGFLCKSDQPYDHFAVHTQDGKSYLAFTSLGKTDKLELHGKVLEGQTPVIESRQGLYAVPIVRDGKSFVDVYYHDRRVASQAGGIVDVDISGEKDTLILVSTSITKPPEEGRPEVQVLQSLIDAQGSVLASRRIPMVLAEDGILYFRLTQSGDGIYRLLSENDSTNTLEVLDSRTFKPIFTASFPEIKFTDILMLDAATGFVIGNGQLYYIDAGDFRQLMESADAFYATRIVEYNQKAGRVLVVGRDGYFVFDSRGQRLLGQKGLWDVKLAIDGSVAQHSAENEPVLWSNSDRYAQSKPLAIPREEWNFVACFTPNSIALIKHDATSERGILKMFKQP